MRKICDPNNGSTSANFRCKKARNRGDCGGSVKVYYLLSNSLNFCFDVRTLSAEPYQLYSITAGGKEIKDDGPAVILIIED